MKRYLIHIENIVKQNQKVVFQIKLPSTITQVVGIMITANPNLVRTIPNDGEDNPNPGAAIEGQSGFLQLRIPEKRDAFYAEYVNGSAAEKDLNNNIKKQGLGEQNKWWFDGRKRDFFKIGVPIEDTIIDGFYEDLSSSNQVDYKLKIYLEISFVKSRKISCAYE